MSDETKNARDEFARLAGVSYDDLSENLKSKYGPGSMSDDPDIDSGALADMDQDRDGRTIIFTTELDNLLMAGIAGGALFLGVRRFVKTYKGIDKVRKGYARFYG